MDKKGTTTRRPVKTVTPTDKDGDRDYRHDEKYDDQSDHVDYDGGKEEGDGYDDGDEDDEHNYHHRCTGYTHCLFMSTQADHYGPPVAQWPRCRP